MRSGDCGHALHTRVNCVWVQGLYLVCFSWGHREGAVSALTLALSPSVDPGNGQAHTGMPLQESRGLGHSF